ncbi:MAG: tetratricopeptide repeat protein [Bacteroidia bacterium]|nr:tetratricopeptide repeat protein [Bacteroidia bacterium]
MLIILALTFVAYFNVIFADFVSWDDADFTVNNKDVKTFDIKSFFSNFYLGNYVPLTMMSFSVDYLFGKDNTWVYHFHNILLHGVVSIFVFFLFNSIQSNKQVALFTALIFALHPMQTESVSWVSERKNLVCGLFYLLTLLSYIRYIKSENLKNYFIVIIPFIFALFSKGMAVSLPFTLFAIDIWLNRKFNKKLVLEKIPFFILSVIFGIIAIKAQSSAGFLKIDQDFSLLQKIQFSGYAFMQYVLKLFIPLGLSAVYPYPNSSFNFVFLSGILFFLITLFIFFYTLKTNRKTLAGGLLFFIGNIIFVLQFFAQGAVLMADHYIYIASLGIIFPSVIFIFSIIKKTNFPILASSILVLFCLFATHFRNNVWKNNIVFWEDVVKKYPNSEIALSSLGSEYMLKNNDTKAISCFNKAIDLNPNYLKAYYNRGLFFAKKMLLREALLDFTKAIELGRYSKAYLSRAEVYYNLKNYPKTFSDLDFVLNEDPNNIGANFVSGNCYSDLNQLEKAIFFYTKCISLNPNEPTFYLKRAIALGKQQKFNECLNDLNTCTTINPNFAEAFYWKGVAKIILKQNPCSDLEKALSLGYVVARDSYSKYCK